MTQWIAQNGKSFAQQIIFSLRRRWQSLYKNLSKLTNNDKENFLINLKIILLKDLVDNRK